MTTPLYALASQTLPVLLEGRLARNLEGDVVFFCSDSNETLCVPAEMAERVDMGELDMVVEARIVFVQKKPLIGALYRVD